MTFLNTLAPAPASGILVLEDINEHPFRVERMLLQLYYASILERQSAVILGSFTGAAPNDYDAGYSLETMVDFMALSPDPATLIPNCQSGFTYGEALEYAVFHIAYHTGQMYSVRHLLGDEPPDN